MQLDDAHVPRIRESNLGAAFSNISGAIGGVGTALVFAVGAYEVLRGRLTAGQVVSTSALAGMVFGPVARLADLAYVFEQTAASVARLGEILDLEPDVREPGHAEIQALPDSAGRVRGEVEFDRVGFGYLPRQPVVWDIRLRVGPGMKVALVGPTGCGKSTLVNLLMRFYDPSWGEIRLDGVPIRRVPTRALRQQIGVVLQDPVVFRLSLADNIRYGAPRASDEQVEAVARAALVHSFAMALPEGYQTLVGEGGFKLSQGERQRLAIARALCKAPSLVVLDEATSSLDTASESLIQAALANLLRGRTAFIIAHRLSTIVDADLIVVMDGGLIVQVGTHAQLLADQPGLYRRLCARQFGEPGRAIESQRISESTHVNQKHPPLFAASRA
jgi:ABC-type multidrug transport system fused ATPase/permease subunit